MKRTLVIAIVLLTGQAWGEYHSGNKLLALCVSDTFFETGQCLGFLTGISDSINIMEETVPNPSSRRNISAHICKPESVTIVQLEKVWIKWANEHPERLQFTAVSLVMQAFAEAWPCP